MTDQSDHSNQVATVESPVTMRVLQAIMNSFKLEIRAMENRINSKIVESRSRLSLSTPQQPSPLSSNQVTQLAISSISQVSSQLDSSITVT